MIAVTVDGSGKILAVSVLHTHDIYRSVSVTPDGNVQYIFTYDVAFIPLEATVDVSTGEILYERRKTNVLPVA